MIACSGSSSFSLQHSFGLLSLSVCSHAHHTESWSPWMKIPRVWVSAGFSTPLTCLHWSIDEFSNISFSLLAADTCCSLCNNLAGPQYVPISICFFCHGKQLTWRHHYCKLLGHFYCREKSISRLTARFALNWMRLLRRCCNCYFDEVESMLRLWSPLMLI